MEREILFRGQRADDGAWVYGWYSKYSFNSWSLQDCIIPKDDAENGYLHHVEVDPATLGQYTGLDDRNGVKIWENDIIHIVTPNTNGNYQLKYAFGQFYIGINMPLAYLRNSCEVIGNIHDKPELLGGNDGKAD